MISKNLVLTAAHNLVSMNIVLILQINISSIIQ
jgi:hypothetical protein